jgi:hypothetical protein
MGFAPKALQDRPALLPHLDIYWSAYRRMSRARRWNDGMPQAVAITECFGYCDGLGWRSPAFKEAMLDYVQELDDVFIEHHAQKRMADNGAGSDVVGP